MTLAKSFNITKRMVWEAYKCVKRSKGGPGHDKVAMEDFETKLKDNLYKLWNRLSSGTYSPPPVLQVEIPKTNGGVRKLGIPTISDRIAQMVIKNYLEEKVEPYFHEDSYGYRPNKSALQAVAKARTRCWRDDWVLDLDIKSFFDTLDHRLVIEAVKRFTNCKWVLLYIERWLKADIITKDGKQHGRNQGTPQGGVISPLLSNIYLHLAFDQWMQQHYPRIHFERYADDIIIHCRSAKQVEMMKQLVGRRLERCKLQLNVDKTKIAYCKDSNRSENWENTKFDFLGFTFRPRLVRGKERKFFVSFCPAISNAAAKNIRQTIKGTWNLKNRIDHDLQDIAKLFNPVIQGWINYYSQFHGSALYSGVIDYINTKLVAWVKNRYKKFKRRITRASHWLKQKRQENPTLFAHWKFNMQ